MRTSHLHPEGQVRMPRCTILYKNKQLTIIGEGREKLCVSSVTIIYEQINYWFMPRADVVNDLWDNKKPLFFFFSNRVHSLFYHSIGKLCLLCNLLDPHTKNPNYTFKVRAYAVNFFLLDLFAFPKSFFLSLGINSALFLAGRGFRKIPEVQEVHFKAFQ